MNLEEIFLQEIMRDNITIVFNRSIKHAAFLTALPDGFLLSVSRYVHGPEKLEAVAFQIGRIALGHDFQRSGYKDAYLSKAEWLEAADWAAVRLVKAKLFRLGWRHGLTAHDLAEMAGVTPWLVQRRRELWDKERGVLLPFRAPPAPMPAMLEGFWMDEGFAPFF